MTIRIFVLMTVAALCLIAASPKNHDVDGDGYGQQMVTEKAAPLAPGISASFSSSAGNVVFTTTPVFTSSNPSGSCTTPDGSTAYTCGIAVTAGSGTGSFVLPLPTSR